MQQINGTLIRHYRLKQSLSLADLARRLGIGRTEMLKIEEGRRSISDELMQHLVVALGIEA